MKACPLRDFASNNTLRGVESFNARVAITRLILSIQVEGEPAVDSLHLLRRPVHCPNVDCFLLPQAGCLIFSCTFCEGDAGLLGRVRTLTRHVRVVCNLQFRQ